MDASDLSQTAQENLRVIRNLMERATVYRVISAVPALFAGVLAIAVGGFLMTRPAMIGSGGFVLIWLAVYLAVDGFNALALYREAKRRGAAFPSSQMLYALLALVPPMAGLGLIGLVFALAHGELVRCVLFWVIGYGLGLLGTSSFAPRSIQQLGWVFLVVGLTWFLWTEWQGIAFTGAESVAHASLIMAISFGGIHLIYGIVTGLASRKAE